MTTRKPKKSSPPKAPSAAAAASECVGSVQSTVSGPSTLSVGKDDADAWPTSNQQRLAAKMAATQALAEKMPENPLKADEYGVAAAHAPRAGAPQEPDDARDTASTVTEDVASDKLGAGQPNPGHNAGNDPLDRVRVDSTGRPLTTSLGTRIADNQNSLKAGLRGPTLLEDFVLRDKITHFDHERIPERVVHARGSGAHGYFECTQALADLTIAAPFRQEGKRTPVFVRFSTVVGERGSIDTARDVRGFAVKFYTEEGNWDLVGNNIPVFFIQDAMKFPDLVHSIKPEPHHAMPQASSAHDTFWDFAGLMPEITHMLMWVMSDRAIPRSYRTMQGFGVHTFRLVNAKGESVLCKFHWSPVAGTHSLVWDEAVKLGGADADFHRRDLWEAIESGNYPEYELGLQLFTEQQAEAFSFDVLDATKIVPEELVPLRTVGRLVLNRNPDNFFAETEQIAFCTQHVVPGIDFTNDPLLQGRNFSYHDTQLTRLGGPNFNQIPINAPVAQVHNNQRDGFHRSTIERGRVAYEPNSLGGGCPFQAGMRGFVPFPQPVQDDKLRGKPEKFADHFSQARLFWRSQTSVEQNHIVAAFRFELTRVQTQAVRERIVSMLANVADELAQRVAEGLGIEVPQPMPPVLGRIVDSEVEQSPALSLLARPGDGSVRGLRVALLVADGCVAASLRAAHGALAAAGAAPRLVGQRLGVVTPNDGGAASGSAETAASDADPIHVEVSIEAMPSVLWDAVVLPDGAHAQSVLSSDGKALEFVKDQYRHCKPILALGSATTLLEAAGIPAQLPDGGVDPGVIVAGQPEAGVASQPPAATQAIERFIAALAKRRHFERETDPPAI